MGKEKGHMLQVQITGQIEDDGRPIREIIADLEVKAKNLKLEKLKVECW